MTPILLNTGPSAHGWHYYAAFLRCPTSFYWHSQASGTGCASDPLVRGTIFHVGLAHKFARELAVTCGQSPDAFYAPLRAMELVAKDYGDVGARNLHAALRGLLAHEQAYGKDRYETIGIETPIDMSFEHGSQRTPYTARIDRIVRGGDGKVRFMDHKLVSRIEDKVFKRYALSGQFLGQLCLGRARYGDAFGGLVLNVVDTKGACERREPEPAPFALSRFPQVICDADEAIGKLDGRDVSDYPMALNEVVCVTPYGLCEWFDRCRWGRKPTDT